MRGKPPRGPPRFRIGETVKIVSTRRVRFDGLTGVVVEVQESRHAQTLDKYVVQLDEMSQSELFWDIELVVA
jgi:hypothetical protein